MPRARRRALGVRVEVWTAVKLEKHAEAVKRCSRAQSSSNRGASISTDEARTPRHADIIPTATNRVDPAADPNHGSDDES